MSCKDIEQLIIDSSDKDLSLEELDIIEQHVAFCTNSARFREDLDKIRASIKTIPQTVPSPDLVENTRVRCQAELRSKAAADIGISPKTHAEPMPKYVLPVLFSLILLTAFIIAPMLKSIKLDQPLTFSTVAVLTLLIQNAAMLFFSPIIIRKYRWKKRSFKGTQVNANAS
jgi:hypothetical protein